MMKGEAGVCIIRIQRMSDGSCVMGVSRVTYGLEVAAVVLGGVPPFLELSHCLEVKYLVLFVLSCPVILLLNQCCVWLIV